MKREITINDVLEASKKIKKEYINQAALSISVLARVLPESRNLVMIPIELDPDSEDYYDRLDEECKKFCELPEPVTNNCIDETDSVTGTEMPQIIPIKDLKNTSEISDLCHKVKKPIYITKNGYGDMVIMSMETYEKTIKQANFYRELELLEKQIENGEVENARASLASMRKRYEL